MGVNYSSLRSALGYQHSNEKCYPSVSYSPLPTDIYTANGGQLLVAFRALPSQLMKEDISATDTVWWTDAQFLPYNDHQLAAITTPYQLRPGQAWLPKISTRKIFIFDIGQKPIKCIHLKRPCTSQSGLPKIHPHPLGEFIASVESSQGVKIINLNNEEVYSQPATLNTGSCKCCDIAANGLDLVTVFRGQGFFTLCLHSFDSFVASKSVELKCHHVCPGFLGDRAFTDQVECKWSKDSQLIAVSYHNLGSGKLFVIDKVTLKNICTVCPDLLASSNSSSSSLDFDPRPDYNFLAVGTTEGAVHIVDVRKSEVHMTFGESSMEAPINCVQFNVQGTRLAVAYGNMEVKIFDTDSQQLVHEFDLKIDNANLCKQIPADTPSAVMGLSFNFSGSLLATSSWDGIVRVWCVPAMFTLQKFCKLKILSLIPVRNVKKLNLPTKIKDFLLST